MIKNIHAIQIILASSSPRRRELLTQLGLNFLVMPSNEEEHYQSDTPEEIVKELALLKASSVAKSFALPLSNTLIIGADTIVVLDGEVLGKPTDKQDAIAMLTKLQGRTHQVFTGVSLLMFEYNHQCKTNTFVACTKVFVNEMSLKEIQAYVESGEPMDKAGSYGIQGVFAKHIGRIEGDYSNVMGLPIATLYEILKKI
ncbi:MAG: Maf family protein [Lachnospiraceae bacterium]|nr:Maf family protein [Lachnospiraceae bacterium]